MQLHRTRIKYDISKLLTKSCSFLFSYKIISFLIFIYMTAAQLPWANVMRSGEKRPETRDTSSIATAAVALT